MVNDQISKGREIIFKLLRGYEMTLHNSLAYAMVYEIHGQNQQMDIKRSHHLERELNAY